MARFASRPDANDTKPHGTKEKPARTDMSRKITPSPDRTRHGIFVKVITVIISVIIVIKL
jgi:hypothetical protein